MMRNPMMRGGFIPVALLTLVLTACAQAQPTAPQAPAVAEEKPQYGGTLVFGGLSAPAHLDVLAAAATGDNRNSSGVYDRLLNYDYADPNHTADYKLVPGLADRWEMSPDGKTYTFFLHKGVKWHDGEDFTAADVVYTYKRIIEIKSPLATNIADMDKIEALDPNTLKLTNKVADAAFLIGLAGSNMGIQPKHLVDKGMDLRKTAIGTGPFKLESFDPKSHTVWVKNPNYWQQGLPYMDKVDLIWSLDKPSLLAAVAIGKVDTTYSFGKVDYETVLKTNPNIKALKFAFAGPVVMFNIEHPPLNDLRVRRAIHLAVDRQELIKINGLGEGKLSCYVPGDKVGWCLPGWEQLPGFRQPKDQDLAEAKRLLAEAGYPNGFEVKLLYKTTSTQSVAASEPLAGQMARIGLRLVLDGRDNPTTNEIFEIKGNYEMILNQSGAWGNTTSKRNLVQWYSVKGPANLHGIGNAELDKLIDQQAVTFNNEERKKLWHQMEKIVLDNVWAVPLTDNLQYNLVQPWVKGPMVLTGDNTWQTTHTPLYATTWLDQKMLPQR